MVALTLIIDGNHANSSVHAERAVAHTRLGDEGKALLDWRKAVELKPRDAWLRASLAASLKTAGQLEEALREATASIELNAAQPKVGLTRGELCVKLKLYAKVCVGVCVCACVRSDWLHVQAVEDLTQALARDQSGASVSALYYRALAHVGLQNTAGARDDIVEFLKLKPHNQQALALLQAVQEPANK